MDEAPRSAFVHQAAGMVSVQLGITPEEALFRLEARAVLEDRLVGDLARDVIERRVRFEN